MVIIILSIIFVILLVTPLAGAWIYYARTRGVILKIRQDMVKDPRYFSHSFSGLIRRALPEIRGNTIRLHREEHFLKPGDLVGLHEGKEGNEVDELVLAIDEEMVFSEHLTTYYKEIYCTGDVTVDKPGRTLRALYSEKRIALANKTTLVRWVDAEQTLAVYDDCDLGMSATAGSLITVGKNVRFRRLYAPSIYFGQYPSSMIDPMEGRNEQSFMLPVIHEKKKETHITHENMTEAGTAPFSIVTTKTMVVEDAILQGDIHTDGSVRICEGAGVLGNIFSEKGILIEKGAFVVGNVFSQGKIEIRSNVMIGRKGQVVSVISRDQMIIGENVVIYGYVSSETLGVCCPIYNAEEERYRGSYDCVPYVVEKVDVRFENLEEYVSADDMAFRKDTNVVSATIPEGAESIRRSMFCGCRELVRLSFPDTLKELQDYTLMDCGKLSEISSFEHTSLETIGVSAMENCAGITSLKFPASLTKIGPAGCAGMTGLKEVTFPEDSRLKVLDEHAFRDCRGLESFTIPDSVETVGVSAFRGCESLKTISLPKKLLEEPGVAELEEILPGAKLMIRREETGG